jgi:hypothetical protein
MTLVWKALPGTVFERVDKFGSCFPAIYLRIMKFMTAK